MTVSYVGSRGQRTRVAQGDQRAAARTSTTGRSRAARTGRSFPQYRSIVEFTNDSQSWYDSLQLSYRQNAWHGINTQ